MTDDIHDENTATDSGMSFETEFAAHTNGGATCDDDTIIRNANEKITAWKAAGTPSLTEVQVLFHESICASASAMARDKIVAAIITAFDHEVGGKRALISAWNQIAKDYAEECAQAQREMTAAFLERLPLLIRHE